MDPRVVSMVTNADETFDSQPGRGESRSGRVETEQIRLGGDGTDQVGSGGDKSGWVDTSMLKNDPLKKH